VCTALRKAARAISRVYDDALAVSGLSVSQLAVLRAVARAGDEGAPLSRLAEALVMDKTSLYRSLGPLIHASWVTVSPGVRGRTKLARLTEEGRRITDGAAESWESAQSKVVDAFGVGRWADLQKNIAELTALGVRLGT
jgi:DNA-binding MarR family transcriptional regulator